MKKLLNILAAFSLTSVATISVVACGPVDTDFSYNKVSDLITKWDLVTKLGVTVPVPPIENPGGENPEAKNPTKVISSVLTSALNFTGDKWAKNDIYSQIIRMLFANFKDINNDLYNSSLENISWKMNGTLVEEATTKADETEQSIDIIFYSSFDSKQGLNEDDLIEAKESLKLDNFYVQIVYTNGASISKTAKTRINFQTEQSMWEYKFEPEIVYTVPNDIKKFDNNRYPEGSELLESYKLIYASQINNLLFKGNPKPLNDIKYLKDYRKVPGETDNSFMIKKFSVKDRVLNEIINNIGEFSSNTQKETTELELFEGSLKINFKLVD